MNTGQILRGEQVRCRVARTQSDGGGIAYGLCQDFGLFHAICHGEFAGFFVKKTGSLAFRPIKFQVALILTETAIVGIEGNSAEACSRLAIAERGALRPEERRVGQGWGSKGRTR